VRQPDAHPLLPALDELRARHAALVGAGLISDLDGALAFSYSLAELRRSLVEAPPCSLCRLAGGEGCESRTCRAPHG
jgi:hypothetical protein